MEELDGVCNQHKNENIQKYKIAKANFKQQGEGVCLQMKERAFGHKENQKLGKGCERM